MWANYESYLKSDVWRAKRKQALDRAANKCQTCNAGQKLQVHHRKYSTWGDAPIEDLTVLCESCHNLFTHKSPNSHVVQRRKFKKSNHRHKGHKKHLTHLGTLQSRQNSDYSHERQTLIDNINRKAEKKARKSNKPLDKLFVLAIKNFREVRVLIDNRKESGLDVEHLLPKLKYWQMKLPPGM